MNRKTISILVSIAVVATALAVLLIGCSQEIELGEVVNVFSGNDSSTPVLVRASTASSNVVLLEFSEPVRVYGSSFEPFLARADGKFIYVTLNRSLRPGIWSTIEGRVRDYSGNTTGFSVQVWGLNPCLPGILINEFTTKGTRKSPDRTELRILSDGNLNGITLYSGVPDDFDVRFVFGDISVSKGDMVVVWWTEGLPDGIPEKEAGVVNVYTGSSEALPSNNGTIVICDTPSLGAGIIDAVIYSNFSSSHEGYGTKSALQRAKWVLASGAWEGDPLDSTSSTATRSMFRAPDGADTNSCREWAVTVTGGCTFGVPNTSESI